MKISVSLPDDDVAFVDDYLAAQHRGSRSAVLHEAIALLRQRGLSDQYASAAAEWDGSEDAALWDTTVGDGVSR